METPLTFWGVVLCFIMIAYLRKRDRIYHIIYFNEFGERHSFTTKKIKLAQAERELEKFRAKRTLGLPIDEPNRTHKHLFSEVVNEFLNLDKDRSPETIKIYKSVNNQWKKLAGDKNLTAYSKDDWKNFKSLLEKSDKAQPTIANYSRHLFIEFQFFLKKKYIKENPITHIKAEDKEPEPIEMFHYNLIRRYYFMRGQFKQFDLVSLLFLCALRITEGINMEGSDFDFKNKIIYIRNRKGKRIDKIPMLKDIEEHLLQMEIPEGRLFNYASRDAFQSTWNTANDYWGFNDTLHSLRKARGSQLANSGVEPLFLQKFMRHKDIRTTMKFYVKIDLAKMRNGIDDKLED